MSECSAELTLHQVSSHTNILFELAARAKLQKRTWKPSKGLAEAMADGKCMTILLAYYSTLITDFTCFGQLTMRRTYSEVLSTRETMTQVSSEIASP